MSKEPPILEMTAEGDFVTPPPNAKPDFGTRVLIWVAAFAAIAVSCVVSLFALWLLAVLLPVALLAVIVAYAMFRFRMWRNGGSIQGGTIRWVRRR